MFEGEDIYQEFSRYSDYTSRLIYIKKKSKKINNHFIDLLSLHAKVMLDEGELPLAIELADLALSASLYIDDRRIRGSCLVLKSQLLQIQNGYDEAEGLLFEAKELYEKEGLEEKICDVLNLIAYLYKAQKKYDLAIEYYKKAIEMSQKLNRKELYALNLSAIGEIEYHKNRPQQALWHFEQSLQSYKSAGDVKSQCQILNWIGYININLKNYQDACENFMTVLELLAGEKDRLISSLAYSKFHLGTIYQHLNRPDDALNYLLDALRIWKRREALQVVSEICFYKGQIYKSLGFKEESLEFFRKSLHILNRLSTRKGVLSIIFQIRNLEGEEACIDSIHNYFAKHLNTKLDMREDDEKKLCSEVISSQYRDFPYKDEKSIYFIFARPSFTRKLNAGALKDNQRKHFAISHSHLSIAFRQIAGIYGNKKLPSLTLPYIIELLELKQKFYHSSLVKNMIEGLGELSLLPDKEDSYTYYIQEIIRLLKKFVSNSDQALITYNIGLMYFAGDDYKKAGELLLKSFDISSRFKNKTIEARVCRALAWSKFQQGSINQGINYLKRALKINEASRSREELLDLLLLGRFYLEKKEIAKSLEYQARTRSKANNILCLSNPLINIKSNLLKSGTYYHAGVLLRRELHPSMLDFSLIFDQDSITKKSLRDITSTICPEEKFWEFLSCYYLAMGSLSKSGIYEATHFILKALKNILFLPVKEKDKIFLLRIGLIYQSLDMSMASKWHLRMVDEYYRDLVREKNTLSPFAYRAAALFNIAVILCMKGDYSKAITALLEAEDIEQIEKNHFRLARIYYQNGIIKEYQENERMASWNYNRALEIYLSLGDNQGIVRCLNKMAIMGDNKKDQLLGALALINPGEKPLLYGQIIFNWAIILKKEGNFLWESMDAMKEALKYFRRTKFVQYTVRALYTLAGLSLHLGQKDMAVWYQEEAWQLLKIRIPRPLWKKFNFLTPGKDYSIKKHQKALFIIQNILFGNLSLHSSSAYSYRIYMELAKFFDLFEDEKEREKYEKLSKERKREIIDLLGEEMPVFVDDKVSFKSYNIIIDDEELPSEAVQTGQEGSLKNKILPLIHYLKNVKENETLIRKYISEVISEPWKK